MKKNILWKSLPADMKPHGFQYEVGKLYKHDGEIEICESGFHASRNVIDAMGYVNCEILSQVEVRGKNEKQDDKEVWSEIKIVKAWKWEKEDSVAHAIFAAELCIKNFEKEFPDDKRPREAIEAAKEWLRNPNEKTESAARSAARSAESAESAAESAAWSAAWSARSARSAAESAARSAARSAAESAESAAKTIKDKCQKFVIERLKNKKPL